jgi:hypothetical protein
VTMDALLGRFDPTRLPTAASTWSLDEADR